MNKVIAKCLVSIWFIMFIYISIVFTYNLNRYMNHLSLVNICNEYVSNGYKVIGDIEDVSSYELNDEDMTITIKSVISEDEMVAITVMAGLRFTTSVAVSPILILYNYLAETILF